MYNGLSGSSNEKVSDMITRVVIAGVDAMCSRRPVPISALIVETPEEHRLFEEGERNSKHRKEFGKISLAKHTPNDEESDIIHALWQKQLQWHG